MVPGRPLADEIRVRDQDARCVLVRAEHADRLARLNEQGLVVGEPFERRDDGIERLPIARGAADAAINDELFRVLGNGRIEVVVQHA